MWVLLVLMLIPTGLVGALGFADVQRFRARRKIERANRSIGELHQLLRTSGHPLRLVGAAGSMVTLGPGRYVEKLVHVRAVGCELRGDAGETVWIEGGATLYVFVRAVTIVDDMAQLAAGTELYLCRPAGIDQGPLRTAAGATIFSGELVMLFEASAPPLLGFGTTS